MMDGWIPLQRFVKIQGGACIAWRKKSKTEKIIPSAVCGAVITSQSAIVKNLGRRRQKMMLGPLALPHLMPTTLVPAEWPPPRTPAWENGAISSLSLTHTHTSSDEGI